jgi:hypothetical protein
MRHLILDTVEDDLLEGEEVDYRKLPYIKVNMIKAKHTEPVKTEKEKASEWRVRKENIDKIKLPVFCSFDLCDGRPRRLGILVNSRYKTDPMIPVKEGINLYEIDKQTGLMIGDRIDSMSYYKNKEEFKKSLAHLIEIYKINIGKVKINFYE